MTGWLDRIDERFDRRVPPRRYRIDDYKRWFPRTAELFGEFLDRPGALPPAPTHRAEQATFGVVVMPWVSTAVPWYAIALASGLARRGREVVLLWDDAGYPELHQEEQLDFVSSMLERVGAHFPVLRLSEAAPAPPADGDDAVVERLTEQNLVWTTRGGEPSLYHQRLTHDVRAVLARALPRVRATFDRLSLDAMIVPGGVYGTSGLWLHEAARHGCRGATFDTDRSIAQICVSGVAAQNGDIARAFEEVWHGDERGRRFAVDAARAEYERRTEGRDDYGFQTAAATGDARAEGAILVPMNVEWDTAALGRHRAFADTTDWITSTVAAVLAVDDGPVIVRQHPSERRKLQASALDVASALRERFPGDPRWRFVAADEPVSSYDLLRSARLVLPYVSTIAIEAAAIGKPVIVSGAAYYGDLGFVWSTEDRQEYLDLVATGVAGTLDELPDQRDRAWVCYYLTAVRNRDVTTFTPHPDDFWTWCRQRPEELFVDREVANILEALDLDVPLSLLRHRQVVATA